MKDGYYILQDQELGGYALYHRNLDGMPLANPPYDNRIGYGETIEEAEQIADDYEARCSVPFWKNKAILTELKAKGRHA